MQNLKPENVSAWQVMKPTLFFLPLAACLLLWLHPATHPFCAYLDINSFKLLNDSLQHSHALQAFWGYLNHPHESWLNVVVMAGINVLGIFSLAPGKRKHALAAILYFWMFYQFVLFVSHVIFSDLMHIHRDSPSVVLDASVILSKTLNMPTIKVFSRNCFPAGHALVATYWAAFSLFYASPWVRRVIGFSAAVLILPRLFSGAHWLSDVTFSALYGLFWFTVAKQDLIFNYACAHIERLINFFGKKPQRTIITS